MRLLTILFLVTSFLQVNAQSFNDITIKKDRANLETVFLEIEKQSEFRFFFNETLMKQAVPVTIDVKKASLERTLEACFEMQPKLTYAIVEKTIIVKRREVRQTEVNMGGKGFGRLAELRGVVNSAHGPIPGATVTVKGTDKITSTNNSGEFTLFDIDDRAILTISSVSHYEQEVRLSGKGTISITLDERVGDLDEQIVVAYNTSTKKTNVGSVTVVKGKEIQTLPNRSFEKSLQGLVPGLLITKGNGQPGSAPGNFIIRGIATGGVPSDWQSYRHPLVVVDGVPIYQEPIGGNISSASSPAGNPMSHLNPNDIESISILKDASAVALYGSKASNGVILITTKKGKAGKTVFSVQQQTDISERMKDPAVLNQQEYLDLLFEAYNNSLGYSQEQTLIDLRSSLPSELTTSAYFPIIVKSPGDTTFYASPDWNSAMFNKSAVTASNNLTMSGGNGNSGFYLNLEYTKQNGIVRKTGFDRKSFRFNYENRVTPWFKLGLNVTAAYTVQDFSFGSEAVTKISPLLPIRLTNGNYLYNYSWGLTGAGGVFQANPVAASELNINRNTSYRSIAKLYGELKFLKDFTLVTNIGFDYIYNENKQKIHPNFVLINETDPGKGSIRDNLTRNGILISTNILRFNKILNNKHNINLLAGHEAQIQNNKFSTIEQTGFGRNPDATEPSFGTPNLGLSESLRHTLLSYFGQANYSYLNKYFFSGSIRTDGSSRFGANKRFGTYWSTGIGWIISEESLFKKTRNWLNLFKVRGSVGASGNSSAISTLLQYDVLRIAALNGNVVVTPDRENPGNRDLQWESTFSWDAGLEIKMFHERFSVTADIYERKTSELIADNVALPATTGYADIADNIGDLKNSGVELSVSADVVRRKNFRWNISANWSKNKNRLVKSVQPVSSAGNYIVNKEGEAYNSFYLRQWAGVNPANGRPMWIDSTGTANEDYYAAKQEIVGKPQPDGFGSIRTTITIRNFEISGMIYYQYGFEIYLMNVLQNDGFNPYINQSKAALNRWQKPGDVALNPRRLLYGTAGATQDFGTYASTRYLYEGNFIRLANVSLAYNFPKKILDRLHVQMLKLYVQGHNLATWTKYSGQDPENLGYGGEGNLLYPQQRSFSVGLNLNF